MAARKNKLVYLAPAARDMEEIVKYHLTRVGAQSARGIYEQMKKEIGRLSRYPPPRADPPGTRCWRGRASANWC